MSQGEVKVVMTTLSVIQNAAKAANLTFFLFAGSLLGSYRHHGLIPWDDDVDIIFNHEDKSKVEAALRSKERFGYSYFVPSESNLPFHNKNCKFFPSQTGSFVHKVPFSYFNWPFVDIFFFRENSSHIWDAKQVKNGLHALKSHVYPLIDRPFGSLMLPAPCNPVEVLRGYNLNYCHSGDFNHKLDIATNPLTRQMVACDQLSSAVPMVRRRQNSSHVNETLVVGGRVLNTVTLPLCQHP